MRESGLQTPPPPHCPGLWEPHRSSTKGAHPGPPPSSHLNSRLGRGFQLGGSFLCPVGFLGLTLLLAALAH